MNTNQRLFFRLIDALCILLALAASSKFLLPPELDIFADYTGASTFTLFFFFLSFYVFDCYSLGHEDFKESVIRVIVAVVVGTIGTGFLFYSFETWRFPRYVFIVLMAFTLLLCLGWRTLYSLFGKRTSRHSERYIFIGSNMAARAKQVFEKHRQDATIIGYLGNENLEIAGDIAWLGDAKNIVQQITNHNPTGILVLRNCYITENVAHFLLQAKLAGLVVEDMRSLYERLTRRIPVDLIDDDWLLLSDGFNLQSTTFIQRIKRAFDVLFSFFLLTITAPLVLVSMLLVKLESPGPIFYKQQRIGFLGKEFTIYKIRSMQQHAETGGAVWAKAQDSRVTRIGRFIRKTRIDELPQILNVLKGDMSIVGPRPERPDFTSQLEDELPYYQIRHSVKPGITGWAQVCYPYGASVEDALHKLEYDLYYIKHFSLLLEIKIILRTIGVVLLPKGAR